MAHYLSLAKQHLEHSLMTQSERITNVSVVPVSQLRRLSKPLKPNPIKVVPRKLDLTTLNARICVWVDLWYHASSSPQYALPFWFSVAAEGPVWAFNQTVYADRTVVEQHLMRKEVNLTALQGSPISDLSKLHHKKLVRRVTRGEILVDELMTERHTIEIGKPARVVSHSGSVTIESTAEALNNGEVGQRVQLQSYQSNRTFWGVVKEGGLIWVK